MLLSGCAEAKIAEPVLVKVPVAVSCHAMLPMEPEWNVPKLSSVSSAFLKLQAVLADRELGKGYIQELKAGFMACSQ